jgi:hypothetical protein
MSVKRNKFATLQSVALCTFAMLWPSANGALAQQAGFATACAADIRSLCAGITPGQGRLEACIKLHSNNLSEACRAALVKDASIGKLCAADIKENCAGIPAGSSSGRFEACLKAHFGSLSDGCKKAISSPDSR